MVGSIKQSMPTHLSTTYSGARSGFYFAVLEEGRAAAGDSVEWLTRDEHGVTVADIVNLYKADETNQDLLRRASELPAFFGETTFVNASGIQIADLLPDASRIISYPLFFHKMTSGS